jgi:RNA polymerase sigma-70 factor (ECF subfamily)
MDEQIMNQKPEIIIQTHEKELVRRARTGDFRAFSELIERYRSRIFGLALKLAKNREDAEDIFQDTFLKAIDNIQKFRAESSFGTWLYTICVNIVRARYGREQKAELLPLDDYLPAGNEAAEAAALQAANWDDPLARLSQNEVREILDKAIHKLPLKYRIPFLLRYTQDMSVQEVAEALDLKPANAKSRILRARLALRKLLSDYFTEEHRYG